MGDRCLCDREAPAILRHCRGGALCPPTRLGLDRWRSFATSDSACPPPLLALHPQTDQRHRSRFSSSSSRTFPGVPSGVASGWESLNLNARTSPASSSGSPSKRGQRLLRPAGEGARPAGSDHRCRPCGAHWAGEFMQREHDGYDRSHGLQFRAATNHFVAQRIPHLRACLPHFAHRCLLRRLPICLRGSAS